MSLVRSYRKFRSDPNIISQVFGAHESESVSDTVDFKSITDADVKEGKITKVVNGDEVTITKTSAPVARVHMDPPDDFTEDQVRLEPVLRFFHYAHLPSPLREISQPFAELAHKIISTTDSSAERAASLRKLLEAKDCAVRARLISKGDTDV